MNYITNNASFAEVGKRTTWRDVEGLHVGKVVEIWGDQNIAVCEGEEHGMDFTAFVPLTSVES